MKLTITVNLTPVELDAVKTIAENISASFGETTIKREAIEDIMITKALTAGNIIYFCGFKDTLDIAITIDIKNEATMAILEALSTTVEALVPFVAPMKNLVGANAKITESFGKVAKLLTVVK